MHLDEMIALLDKTPLIAKTHPVSACYLPDDITIFETVEEMRLGIDNPSATLPAKVLVITSDSIRDDRFPQIVCEHNPFTSALNEILFDRYDCVAERMLCQSQIAERVVTDVQGKPETEVVILFLVDGLSYHHVIQHIGADYPRIDVEPCLVDVPTVTSFAFPNIVNNPPLAIRLFDVRYQDGLGVSYWTRDDNKLTDLLFRTIPHVEKIGDFHSVLASVESFLKKQREQKVYIQILRTGLDGYIHHQKRQPPVAPLVRQIYQEFESLAELCGRLGRTAHLYLTSDHGILWRDEFEAEIIGSAPGKASARWCTWKDLYQQNETGKRFVVNKQEYYCLGFPKLRRALHIDEQGVHGGISFQESIVPFITIRVVNHAQYW